MSPELLLLLVTYLGGRGKEGDEKMEEGCAISQHLGRPLAVERCRNERDFVSNLRKVSDQVLHPLLQLVSTERGRLSGVCMGKTPAQVRPQEPRIKRNYVHWVFFDDEVVLQRLFKLFLCELVEGEPTKNLVSSVEFLNRWLIY